jgi:hypothetical protein
VEKVISGNARGSRKHRRLGKSFLPRRR